MRAAPAAPAAVAGGRAREMPPARSAGALHGLWWPTLAIAAVFCFITFYAKGGLNLESMTTTELVLTLGAGVTVAVSVIVAAPGTRTYGLWPLGLLLALTALTALSIVWSVQPEDSWQESGRMLAYSGVFAVGIALVRVVPGWWPAVLGGLTLAATVVCGYALATKIFPGSLAPANAYARLEEPYGYWNAIGLTAAIGTIGCMWLGARRTGHALLRALAYPAIGMMLLTLVLAYSRGALVALAVGLALWFCMMPLRLRGAALLIVAGTGAGAVAAWDFSTHALSSEGVALAQRSTAGHQLGALVVAMLLALSIAGVAIGFAAGRRAPTALTRRRAGAALLAAMAVVAIAFAGALAHSQRGLTGSISHAFDALTNPNAKPPPNTPGRLTAVASVRARYWKEAFQIFDAHPALGAGAGGYDTARLRYRQETLEVRHAHGFIVQTLADLGLVGLILTLALALTWMAGAGRCTHPFNRRWTSWRAWLKVGSGEGPGWRRLSDRNLTSYPPQRIGMLSMLCIVVVFGAHSLVDWTWYVPGNACVALLCAGWLAGRGPLSTPAGAEQASSEDVAAQEHGRELDPLPQLDTPTRPSATRLLIAAAAIVAALLAAWSQRQPQRSEEARQRALALLATDKAAASAAAHIAVARDPLSTEALFTLADVQQVSGHPTLARATLERAVRLQPSNPQTWLAIGRYDLANQRSAIGRRATVQELQAAIYLNPESIAPEAIAAGEREAIEIRNDYIQALRATMPPARALKSANGSRGRAAADARLESRWRSAR
jgi:O-Antigen ligase